MELNKYIKAQEYCIDRVKTELKNGKKETHWIWFIFPQLKGLGTSIVSDYYGLKNLCEAQEYYKNKYLKNNLIGCLNIIYNYKDIYMLKNCLGELDTKKLYSCVTLFKFASPRSKIFSNVIDKFFNGLLDKDTVILL